ncbi:MAG: ABC transporter permease [Deltaproteobacteria bacterium]|nr:ABC transporter permease [Deltaproteobacteria bacterium]
MKNLRFAIRSLFRSPLVSTVAVLSLALGIGANAAIFSIFEQAILRPLPVEEPEKLVNLLAPGPKSGSQSSTNAGGVEAIFSYPMFRDLERSQTPLEGLAGHRVFLASLSIAGNTVNEEAFFVSGGYFDVLGLKPTVGRLIQSGDDLTPGQHAVAVLSHDYWRNQFASRETVVGETLVVNGLPMEILGVAPKGFQGTVLGRKPKVFVPVSMRAAMVPGWDDFDNRSSYWLYLFGRLSPGMTQEKATEALNVFYGGLIQEIEVPLQEGLSDATLERFASKKLELEEGSRGQSTLRQNVRPPLLLLLGVSAFVFLIACANLANLLLVRAASRVGEMGVRLSLGARRYQVVALMLVESFCLALLGAGFGLLVARSTLQLVSQMMPESGSIGVQMDMGPTFGWFVLGLTLITGLVGLFPALQASRGGLAATLQGQGGRSSASKGANRFRAAMVTAQIALSMALLISAGLFSKSLLNVSRVDLGIEVEGIATFGLAPELSRYTFAESNALFRRVEEEAAAMPGVTSVGASIVPLISGSKWRSNVSVQGFDAGPDTDTHASFNEVGPDFFSTLGIPLLAGREFDVSDDLGAQQVAIVNEAFARKFELGRNPVGSWMQIGSGGEMDIQIVGMVKDSNYSQVKQAVPPVFYIPYRQDDELGSMNFYVRSAGDPEILLQTLRRLVSALDPNLPVDNLRTLALQVEENVFLDRLLSLLSAAFAALATILAAIGLYGVMAYAVSQRTREIGLRMALGADSQRIRQLILGRVGWMTLAGVGLGVAAALGLSRIAQSLLFELEGNDPFVFLTSIVVLTLVALGAGFLPAQRASRIEPMRALRDG